MANGLTKLAVTLAGVSVALLLFTTTLPQYGDGAIGTVIVFTVAVAAYIVALVIALPLAVRSAIRSDTVAEAGQLYIAIAAPLVVGGLVVLLGNLMT